MVLDYLWGRPTEALVAALTGHDVMAKSARTRLVQVGEMAGPILRLPAEALRSSGLEVMGSGGGSIPPAAIFETFPRLWELAANGELRIDAEPVPLPDVEEAWRRPQPGRPQAGAHPLSAGNARPVSPGPSGPTRGQAGVLAGAGRPVASTALQRRQQRRRPIGLDPLTDQQLARVLMSVPAGGIYLAVALALLVSWIRATEVDDVGRSQTGPGRGPPHAASRYVRFAADKKLQLMLVVTTAGRPGAILDGVKASTMVGGASRVSAV